MLPREKIDTAKTPDGGELVLFQHGADFSIVINGQDLMSSRQHESELELARLGCSHLGGKSDARVLIGGLGLGYTLRQTLDLVGPDAAVVVGELLPAVISWNENHLGVLTDHPMNDRRVTVKAGDVVRLIHGSRDEFDTILLDIDNGPSAITDISNERLYGFEGMRACARALRENGMLAVWSCEPSKQFEQILMRCEFHVRRYRAPAYKGGKSKNRFIWLASFDPNKLPEGGGKPLLPTPAKPKSSRIKPKTATSHWSKR